MKHFTPEGDPKLFACGCGRCDMEPSLRLRWMLDRVRDRAGVPMVVTSGPRCPEYNALIGGAKYSEHIDGDGADILCEDSALRHAILKAAIEEGVNRIGIGKSFIHLGVSESNSQDVIWCY